MAKLVVGLESRAALEESLAGGKGSSLAWMKRNGFAVPDGYVVTSEAFDTLLHGLGLDRPDLAELDEPGLAAVRTRIENAPIPRPLGDRVLAAYRRLGGAVAVRSSMVGEDSEETSFAGQLDTILNVTDEDALLCALRQCWSSAFNSRAVAYRREREDGSSANGLHGVSAAVVVQRMVDAQAAGVAFSADPISGQRSVVIEAVEGLGDRLVSGLATPDRYVVDAHGAVCEVCPAERRSRVLTDDQAIHLAAAVRSLAGQAGAPQDVEWAWDGAEFRFLQCRPITTLIGEHVYSASLMAEMMPGLVKPLLYSTNNVSMARNVFGKIFAELVGPSDTDYGQLVKLIRSRLYVDTTLMGEILQRIGMPANFFEMMNRGEKSEGRRPKMTPGMVKASIRVLGFARRHGFVAEEIEAFVARHNRDLERFRNADWSEKSGQELLEAYDALEDVHGETQWYVFLVQMNMMIRSSHMASMVKRHAPEVVPTDLVRGLAGLKALEPNERLGAMSAQAAELGPQVVDLLTTGDDAEIRAALSGSQDGSRLADDVAQFLDEFGFLSTNGTDFTRAPWAETPEVIWSAIGRGAEEPSRRAAEDAARIREESMEAVLSHLSPLLRLHFRRLVRSAIWHVDLRERASLLYSEDAYQIRRIFLALGDRLVAESKLEQSDDIFFLYMAELRQLVRGSFSAGDAMASVQERRAQLAADAEVELPETITGDHVPATAVDRTVSQDFLVGISGSSGQAEGAARIILDPSEAPKDLTREDILVVPFTDVGWTPLFAGIGGIVAETGGQLSHTAIVAREYGLPAVVNVKKATQKILPRQGLSVDGDAGRVFLRDRRTAGGDEDTPGSES